ncbi:MAG: ABC transporter substrate-binding protein [Proteobacteria bacterium]|nr:ABC transporter substrate-binding protein [Pseudomonadota bacterium]
MRTAKDRFMEEEFRVGGIFPLSGYLSWSGEYKRKAAELKIKMINEAGGINGSCLRLITYDDRSSPEQAAKIAETLVFKHRVVAMVGTGSLPISHAVARIANKYKVPLFLNSGYAIDPVKDLFVFNTAHKTEFAVACSFQYFYEKDINRIALLMPAGPLGNLGSWLGRRLGSQLGIKIVGEERFDVRSPDLTSQLERLRSLKPLALFSFVTGEPAAWVAKKMAQMGMNIPLLVSHGNANPGFLKLVSHIPVPIIVPSGKSMVLDSIPESDPCRNIVMDFNARHVQCYGEAANYYSAELADAIDLVTEGLRVASSDPEEMRDAVENIRKFVGMQGIYDFSPIDHYGTQLEHMVLLTIKDGKWQFAKAFSSIAISENTHTNQKTELIYQLAGLLSKPCPNGLDKSDQIPEFREMAASMDSFNYTNAKFGLYSVVKLYCREKQEMIRAVREEDVLKAKQALYRLLTIALSQHFENLEILKISVLELFLALFDTAVDEGADFDRLVKLKHNFTAEWENVRDRETLCIWIIRVLDRTMDSLSKRMRDKNLGLLKKVFRFIEAGYADNMTVDQIAHEVCLSKSRLIHRMKSQYGLTLSDCIAKVRIEKAKAMLKNTDMSISKIAHEVGYGDQSYFTKVFKKNLNCTPKDFRGSTLKFLVAVEN